MVDRRELMEAALDCFAEGVVLTDADGQVIFWNHAAESVTGFPCIDVVGRPAPWAVEPLLLKDEVEEDINGRVRGVLVHAHHRLGQEIALSVHAHVLRNALGRRVGHAVLFHPAEDWDALPHGDVSADPEVKETQARLEERVEEVFREFGRSGTPFGLLWITVDQGGDLRRTHGARACDAMLERMERTLANGMRPNEEVGRWGDNEFLVVTREATPEALGTRAQTFAGLARTTDFRWWGDRVSLTVSIGAAQVEAGETLVQLLEHAQAAMRSSSHAGGNHIILAPGRRACSPL